MGLKLEQGKRYLNGRGDKLGPMEERASGAWFDQHGGGPYHPDGKVWNHVEGSTANIVAEKRMEMYDPKCMELARHFLGEKASTELPHRAQELAQHIQDEVEIWLETTRDRVLKGLMGNKA